MSVESVPRATDAIKVRRWRSRPLRSTARKIASLRIALIYIERRRIKTTSSNHRQRRASLYSSIRSYSRFRSIEIYRNRKKSEPILPRIFAHRAKRQSAKIGCCTRDKRSSRTIHVIVDNMHRDFERFLATDRVSRQFSSNRAR